MALPPLKSRVTIPLSLYLPSPPPLSPVSSFDLHKLLHNNVYCIEQLIEDRTPYVNTSAPFFPENLLPDWNYTLLARAYNAEGHRVYTHRDLTRVLSFL
jgi:hypothetical protein